MSRRAKILRDFFSTGLDSYLASLLKSILIVPLVFSSISNAEQICNKSASDACLMDPFPPISSSDPLNVFDRAAEIATQCFYDQTFHGLDWSNEVKNARASLSGSSSPDDVQRVLSLLLGKLHASHTEFLLETDQRYWALRSVFSHEIDGAPFYQIGATFERQGNQWFVRSVFENSPAAHSGLKRGDEIVSVNNKPLSPVESFLKMSPGRYAKVNVRKRARGPVITAWIKPVYEGTQRSMLRGTIASQNIVNVSGKRIGYFHLWAGTHDAFKASLENIARIMEQDADALILDIRDGLGGASPEYLDPFLKLAPRIFSKPLYVLINDGVRSGKETLAYLIKTSGRATLIGTKTAGYYLAGRLFTINPDKSALYLAVCGDSPVSEPIEGIGVSPDIEVKAPLPYSAGVDPQLQLALKIAAQGA